MVKQEKKEACRPEDHRPLVDSCAWVKSSRPSEGGKRNCELVRSAVTSDWKLPKRKQGTMLFVLCAPFLYLIYKFVLNTYSKSVVNAIRCI